mgnify:CR=1 FL=1
MSCRILMPSGPRSITSPSTWDFVLLHSGLGHFSPDKALEDYELEDFLFGRPELDTAYYPDKILVFGHTPTRILGGGDKILRRAPGR